MVLHKKICDEEFPPTPITLPTGNHCYPVLYNFPEIVNMQTRPLLIRMEGVRRLN